MKSLLSRSAILENLGKGIVIDPFNLARLRNCSHDVCLGEWYVRRQSAAESSESGISFLNPYDKKMVRQHYIGPLRAKLAGEIPQFLSGNWVNIEKTDQIIIMQPGEMILGHTKEFIGGTKDPDSGRCFTAEMKARTSVGRVGFEVCRCAGWGDVGYVNRWTMEIVCTSTIPTLLVVGTRLAQMKFYEVDFIDDEYLYGHDSNRDHYQIGTDLATIKANWRPELLLPQLTKN